MAEDKIDVLVRDKTQVWLSTFGRTLSVIIFSALCFAVPFLIGHPQLFVGSVVNAALVFAALHFKKYQILPIIILPSLAVATRGLVFGPFTIFLVYLIPFIWLGNMALVWGIKYFSFQRKLHRKL